MQSCSGGREASLSAVHVIVQRRHQCLHTGGYEEEHCISMCCLFKRLQTAYFMSTNSLSSCYRNLKGTVQSTKSKLDTFPYPVATFVHLDGVGVAKFWKYRWCLFPGYSGTRCHSACHAQSKCIWVVTPLAGTVWWKENRSSVKLLTARPVDFKCTFSTAGISKTQQLNLVGEIAPQVRGKMCAFDLGGWTVHFKSQGSTDLAFYFYDTGRLLKDKLKETDFWFEVFTGQSPKIQFFPLCSLID